MSTASDRCGYRDDLRGLVLRRAAHSLVVAATASLVLLLTACVEDLPDASYCGPHECSGLAAHPEYQFLHTLGVPQPLPQEGYGSLGRRITEMDQLIQIAHFITHQGCPSPEMVAPAQLDYYFTPDMTGTFSAAAVCDHGNGDIIALMKPGYEAQFETAYRTVPDIYETRWKQAAAQTGRDCCRPEDKIDSWAYHPVGIGNGFVVFKVLNAVGHTMTGADDAWSYAGLARLQCWPEGKNGPSLGLRSAASPGCYLASRYRIY